MNRIISNFFKVSCAIVLLCTAVSCGTKRKLTSRDYQLQEASLDLGIKIEKLDPVELYLDAAAWIGTPYQYGGMSRRGVDCSGLVNLLFNDEETQLSRSAIEIYERDCKKIFFVRSIKPGDLIFFRTEGAKTINHVGIYLKDNRFIHASTSEGVRVDNLTDAYWDKALHRIGRVNK